MLAEAVFWFSIGVVAYTLVGYGLVIRFLTFLRRRPVSVQARGDSRPPVSIIVAVFNEEASIASRIRNLLELDYPRERMEILVASDGSTDETIRIAKEFHAEGVRVLVYPQRRGKALVHNDAVRAASHDLLVFTDADTSFDRGFLIAIVQAFADNSDVGCVTGNLFRRAEGTPIGAASLLYWDTERRIRQAESDLGILLTASGCCMAMRKSAWVDLRPTDDCDFTASLDCYRNGMKTILAPGAIAEDVLQPTSRAEFRARIRMTSKNLAGTLRHWGNAWMVHPLASLVLLSHKILRWFMPFFLASALVSSFVLFGEARLYRLVVFAALVAFILALVGFIADRFRRTIPLASMMYAFGLANLAMAIGVVKGVAGRAPAVFSGERR